MTCARMQERVYIESPGAGHEYYPDVRVIERPGHLAAGGGTTVAPAASSTRTEDGALTPAQPIVIHLDNEPATEGYIEIVDVKVTTDAKTVVNLDGKTAGVADLKEGQFVLVAMSGGAARRIAVHAQATTAPTP